MNGFAAALGRYFIIAVTDEVGEQGQAVIVGLMVVPGFVPQPQGFILYEQPGYEMFVQLGIADRFGPGAFCRGRVLDQNWGRERWFYFGVQDGIKSFKIGKRYKYRKKSVLGKF